jgi:hypothetical protein
MFVAVTGLPADSSAMQGAAALCGLTMMEVRARCAGALPRILVRQAAEDEARRFVAGLGALGFGVFAAEVRQVPVDAQRIVARQLEWTDSGFAVTDGRGTRHDCPFSTLALLQFGFRATSHAETVKTTERKFSMGKALMTGGLAFSKTVEKVTEQVSTNREFCILATRTEGLPAIILYELRLGFQCLGAELKPSRYLNLKALLERLRASHVPVDERTAQPAYLRGLPQLGVDELDLGLFLVREAMNLEQGLFPGAGGILP